MSFLHGASTDTLRRTFGVIDVDGNGVLTASEFIESPLSAGFALWLQSFAALLSEMRLFGGSGVLLSDPSQDDDGLSRSSIL